MNALQVAVGHTRGTFQLRFDGVLPARGVTALLGPSGSGKSTVLRMIAGLERPREGRIACGERVWFDAARRIHVPPQRRRVGMLFQDYGLFGHLTVAENVAYGIPSRQGANQVRGWLERLHLAPYAERYPQQLSGGQRQRVALARALAPQPDVLLLDEPFSALDVTLRHHLRQELLDTVGSLERPVLLVTHDLDDARHLAERVGVLVDGSLLRCGSTSDVLANPGSRAVAQVLGWRNFLPVRAIAGRRVAAAWGELELESEPPVDTAWIGIRPEHVRLARGADHGLAARIERITALGAVHELLCRLPDDTAVHVHTPWDRPVPAPGEPVRLHLPSPYLRLLPRHRTPAQPIADQPDGGAGTTAGDQPQGAEPGVS